MYVSLLKLLMLYENFLVNLLKTFARKDFFPTIFSKNLN